VDRLGEWKVRIPHGSLKAKRKGDLYLELFTNRLVFEGESALKPIRNTGIVKKRTVGIAEKALRPFIKSVFCCTCQSGKTKNTDFLVKADINWNWRPQVLSLFLPAKTDRITVYGKPLQLTLSGFDFSNWDDT